MPKNEIKRAVKDKAKKKTFFPLQRQKQRRRKKTR
jgi:hypothetical protein